VKKIFVFVAIFFLVAFTVLPSTHAFEQGEGYVLIFFSDMGFDQPLLLTTYDEDVELTATGSFQLSDVSKFTQIRVNIHHEMGWFGLGITFAYSIKINGKLLVNNVYTTSGYGLPEWSNITVGSNLLKEGTNVIEVTMAIKNVPLTLGSQTFVIYSDSFLFISNGQYSPPFLVTTDISEYLTQLRQAQISMKETLETQRQTIDSQQQQLTELSNKIDSMTYLLITALAITIISITLNIHLYRKRQQPSQAHTA